MPITKARTTPPFGLRNCRPWSQSAAVMLMPKANAIAVTRWTRAGPPRSITKLRFKLLAAPFDSPVERVDVFLAESGSIGQMNRIAKAFFFRLHRGGPPCLLHRGGT